MNAMTRRRTAALIRRGQAHVQPAMTLHRLLLSGLVALGMTPATVATAAAQPFTGASAGSAVGQAYALAARIHAFHRVDAASGELLPHHARRRGDHGRAGAARKPGDSLPPARFAL